MGGITKRDDRKERGDRDDDVTRRRHEWNEIDEERDGHIRGRTREMIWAMPSRAPREEESRVALYGPTYINQTCAPLRGCKMCTTKTPHLSRFI